MQFKIRLFFFCTKLGYSALELTTCTFFFFYLLNWTCVCCFLILPAPQVSNNVWDTFWGSLCPNVRLDFLLWGSLDLKALARIWTSDTRTRGLAHDRRPRQALHLALVTLRGRQLYEVDRHPRPPAQVYMSRPPLAPGWTLPFFGGGGTGTGQKGWHGRLHHNEVSFV